MPLPTNSDEDFGKELKVYTDEEKEIEELKNIIDKGIDVTEGYFKDIIKSKEKIKDLEQALAKSEERVKELETQQLSCYSDPNQNVTMQNNNIGHCYTVETWIEIANKVEDIEELTKENKELKKLLIKEWGGLKK